MKILLTGISSFTGLWFARALAGAGHVVVSPMRGSGSDDPLRKTRIDLAGQIARLIPDAPFGGEAFLDILEYEGPFDVLCHHGAEAARHKSPDFDIEAAVAANSFNVQAVLDGAAAAGVDRLVLTGSVFESDEGRGDEPRLAFSPYGLSKTATSAIFEEAAIDTGVDLVKFVIPNPFGPYEGATFQRHVMTAWRNGETPHVSHPFYERDNVPVSLLARAYAAAAEGRLGAHVAPSFHAGPVGEFFRRVAAEIAPRTGWACALSLAESQRFEEPRARMNTQPIEPSDYGWSEATFWDEYAAYYAT